VLRGSNRKPCYEGAIGSLKTAREKYISKEYEVKAKAVQKTQNIISELALALDFEKGGEIARNLDSLYNYMLRRIIEGDVKGDMKAFDEVILMLEIGVKPCAARSVDAEGAGMQSAVAV